MKPLAARARHFGPSVFAELTRLAQQHGAVNLGQGFPDFPPPDFILGALRAAADGPQQYAPPAGLPALREALAAFLTLTLGFTPDPDAEITVTVGATEAMHAATQALINPGDDVIVLEPLYDMYIPQVQLAGGTVTPVPLAPDDAGGWRLDVPAIAAALTPRTQAIILNTPHNPTGAVFTRADLDALARLAVAHDLYVLSDEVYDHLVYEGVHTTIASLPGMRERTVTVGSAGKLFSVTGWRLGWAVAPPDITAALRGGHGFVTFAAPTPLQVALTEGLARASGAGYFESTRAAFRARRDRLAGALHAAHLPPHRADGGYFLVADASALGPNEADTARHLLLNAGVAALPMQVFNATPRAAPPALRFAFCKSDAVLDEAARRLTAPRH